MSRFQGNIVVIGAGAAGLYAANRLKLSGFEVIVLEATNQHGGRIRVLNGFGDFPIMLGAENLQAWNSKIQKPLSFLNSDIENRNPNSLIDYDSFKSIYALHDSWIWNDCIDDEIGKAKSFLKTAYLYQGPEMTVAEYLNTLGIDSKSPSWHLYEAWIGSEYGTSIKRMSMKGWAKERNVNLTGDKSLLVNESYLKILDDLYFNNVIQNVIVDTKVVKINYTGQRVSVFDNNGNEFQCSAVLITVPLTVLKNHQIEFEPMLPNNKIEAINGIGMDKGMKLILKFNKRWWPQEMYDVILKGYASIVWSPGKIFKNATDNILTAYIMGEKYDFLSSLNDEAVKTVLVELDSLFGKNIASESFVDSFVFDWGKEDSFQGVYSYPIANTYPETGLSKRQLLAEPLNNRVFFAGEATSNEHSATVHGALESGLRAANEIINSFLQQ